MKLLLIEDDHEDALLTRDALAEAAQTTLSSYDLECVHAESLAAARHVFESDRIDAILLDLNLPDAEGLALVKEVRRLRPNLPVVILSGLNDEDLALRALQFGVQDYLVKGRFDPATLGRTISYALERETLNAEVLRQAKELAEADLLLNHVLEHAADAVVVTRDDGHVIYANPAAARLFGRTAGEMVGADFGLPSGAGRFELEVLRPVGESVTVESHMVPFHWQGASAYVTTFRDITSHKESLQALDELRQRQLQLKDQFLSHVSHELRTPLTVIQQHIELLRDALLGPVNPEQTDSLDLLKRNCRHLEKMIEDLLEATRADAGKLVTVPVRTNLWAVMRETVEEVAGLPAAAAADVRCEIAPDLPDVLADPERVHQILVNLLGNALKFTPADARIAISAAPEPDSESVRCTVRDNGSGVPGEELERIFDPMYQWDSDLEARRKGLGLGLHICRQLVTAMQGRIWAESRDGEGTTFHFTLPAYGAAALLAGLPVKPLSEGRLSLLVITALTRERRELRAFEWKHLDRARRVIGACLMPDRDLLLPRVICGRSGEVIFVVAGAGREGAAILESRVASQLARDPQLERAELDIAIDRMSRDFEPTADGTVPPAALEWFEEAMEASRAGFE